VQSSIQITTTNKPISSFFYRPDALPVAQPTVSVIILFYLFYLIIFILKTRFVVNRFSNEQPVMLMILLLVLATRLISLNFLRLGDYVIIGVS